MNIQVTPGLIRRFEALYMPVPFSGCWIWLGRLNPRGGHGHIREGGAGSRIIKAHRAAFEIYHGPVPDDMRVLHSCDVACCVNPDHLHLGTCLQNVLEMMARGRGRGQFSIGGGRAGL